jgi:hypothetical protein
MHGKEPPSGDENQVLIEGDKGNEICIPLKVFCIPFKGAVVMQNDKCHSGMKIDVSIVINPLPMSHNSFLLL